MLKCSWHSHLEIYNILHAFVSVCANVKLYNKYLIMDVCVFRL